MSEQNGKLTKRFGYIKKKQYLCSINSKTHTEMKKIITLIIIALVAVMNLDAETIQEMRDRMRQEEIAKNDSTWLNQFNEFSSKYLIDGSELTNVWDSLAACDVIGYKMMDEWKHNLDSIKNDSTIDLEKRIDLSDYYSWRLNMDLQLLNYVQEWLMDKHLKSYRKQNR